MTATLDASSGRSVSCGQAHRERLRVSGIGDHARSHLRLTSEADLSMCIIRIVLHAYDISMSLHYLVTPGQRCPHRPRARPAFLTGSKNEFLFSVQSQV